MAHRDCLLFCAILTYLLPNHQQPFNSTILLRLLHFVAAAAYCIIVNIQTQMEI